MTKANEIVFDCLKKAGINQTELAKRMGVDRRNLNQMLRRGQDIKYEKLVEMLECIGFDASIQPAGCYRVNKELAETIADIGEPDGKFWSMIGNAYVGIVNKDSETYSKLFAKKEDLMEWLEKH